MSDEERRHVAKQTAGHLSQLRKLHSTRIETLGGGPVYDAFLFPGASRTPYGPFSTRDEFWAELETGLKGVPERAVRQLRVSMTCLEPYTFTYGDLTDVNVMVEDANVTGIIDWEASGYFPVWWEYAKAAIGLSRDDKEWKVMLQSYMPDFSEAKEWYLDHYSLLRYPNLNERSTKFLAGIDHVNLGE